MKISGESKNIDGKLLQLKSNNTQKLLMNKLAEVKHYFQVISDIKSKDAVQIIVQMTLPYCVFILFKTTLSISIIKITHYCSLINLFLYMKNMQELCGHKSNIMFYSSSGHMKLNYSCYWPRLSCTDYSKGSLLLWSEIAFYGL